MHQCPIQDEQQQALAILKEQLGCDAFLLTVPASAPSVARPLRSPYRYVRFVVLAYSSKSNLS